MKQELKAFLNKYTSIDCQKIIEAAVELQIIYKATLNKNIDCLTCDSKINKAYNELVNYSNSNIIHTMSENFKLKPGQQIFLHSEHKIIHEKNLESDEQAIELLAKNKNLIAAFAEYPEDWEKKVDALSKPSKAEPAEAKKAEAPKETHTGKAGKGK